MLKPSGSRTSLRPAHRGVLVLSTVVAVVIAFAAFSFVVGVVAFLVKLVIVVAIVGFIARLLLRRV